MEEKLRYRDYIAYIFNGIILNAYIYLLDIVPDYFVNLADINSVIFVTAFIAISFLEGHLLLSIDYLIYFKILRECGRNYLKSHCKVLYTILYSYRTIYYKDGKERGEQDATSSRYLTTYDFFKGVMISSFIATIAYLSVGYYLLMIMAIIVCLLSYFRAMYYAKSYTERVYKQKINGHEVIDLGLSVKWATCNVGAIAPEEYGNYYAWGEIKPKTGYTRKTYKWSSEGNGFVHTKYNTDSIKGALDDRSQLELTDDIASVKWGGPWRIPTMEETKELLEKCTWTWTTQNGVKGYEVKGLNGNSIFLPATKICGIHSTYICEGIFWSSSLGNDPDCAFCLFSKLKDKIRVPYICELWRHGGLVVRPVCDK